MRFFDAGTHVDFAQPYEKREHTANDISGYWRSLLMQLSSVSSDLTPVSSPAIATKSSQKNQGFVH